jgi:hypothetical protein
MVRNDSSELERRLGRIYDEPSNVCAEGGEVMLDGPDGIAVSMTADAAEATAQRLLKAALEARDQLTGQASPNTAR